MSQFYKIATLADLPEQGGRLVVVDDAWIGLFRSAEEIYAVDAMCPHAGANLAKGEVCDGVVSCPVHLWRFRLSDGRYLDADVDRYNLKTYRLQIDGNAICVELASEPKSVRLI
ncbi:Rieske (2Fe-2S) protein [Blastopirellula marina]|uniref:Nitrite reductase n=1 Tax=Blastopirellula marina TaxID=124 RepID=A0A2S8G1U1_9BACT|nr:Rieske (2Fe-2S) protein [Blastopirellula marina]PQO38412.1 nitrite reductase [Blastopirellula marina]PTL45069.1 Rieske (2Fe-2S) protein [Blastopirellula marina]